MELLCIKSSTTHDSELTTVIEGCTYNLTKVVRATFTIPGSNCYIWYELLETGIAIHHSSLFVIAPPEIEDKSLKSCQKEYQRELLEESID